jgi:hypothetical protein
VSVRLFTDSPQELLDAIYAGIDDGDIETWDYDDDGDFTHSARQWSEDAWLVPSIADDALVLNILAPLGVHLTKEVYGVYHGRFIEMVCVHFDDLVTDAVATALPDESDSVKG